VADPTSSALRWLSLASGDIAGARVVLSVTGTPPRIAAYLAHQAAVKALKASIASAGIVPARTHDLVGLRAAAPDALRRFVPVAGLRRLALAGLVARYPAQASDLIDRSMSQRLLADAAGIIELVTTYLSSVTSTPNEVEPI